MLISENEKETIGRSTSYEKTTEYRYMKSLGQKNQSRSFISSRSRIQIKGALDKNKCKSTQVSPKNRSRSPIGKLRSCASEVTEISNLMLYSIQQHLKHYLLLVEQEITKPKQRLRRIHVLTTILDNL
jgi:hypothetical protein